MKINIRNIIKHKQIVGDCTCEKYEIAAGSNQIITQRNTVERTVFIPNICS